MKNDTERHTEVLKVRLTPSERRALAEYRKELGLSESAAVRMAVRKLVKSITQ